MFDLVITNKSAKDIKIDWNKSQFVSNGQAKGGFWFEGIVIRDRNMPRAPEIIFAKGSYRKTIAPNASMELSLFPLAHWVVNPMPVGEFGIYVVIDVDGKEVPLKITTSGSQMESKSANSVTVAPPEQTDSKIGAQVQSKAEKLQELKRLHDAGLINSEVYSAQQKIILNN